MQSCLLLSYRIHPNIQAPVLPVDNNRSILANTVRSAFSLSNWTKHLIGATEEPQMAVSLQKETAPLLSSIQGGNEHVALPIGGMSHLCIPSL